MPLPVRLTGGDQIVDGGNQQRRAEDTPLLRLGEKGLQPCGQGPDAAGRQRLGFRRIAVLIGPRAAVRPGSLEQLPRHGVADDRGEIAVGKAELTLQGPPGLQRKAAQIQSDGDSWGRAARQRAGRAHVHARFAAAGARHVEDENPAFGIRLPRFGQRLRRRVLPGETASGSRRTQHGLQRTGLQPAQRGVGTFGKTGDAPDHIRRPFRHAEQMVGKGLVQPPTVGRGAGIGESRSGVAARRALQRRHRMIREHERRAGVHEHRPPIRNPRLPRHAFRHGVKARMQPPRTLPKGGVRLRPRDEQRITGRIRQGAPHKPPFQTRQLRRKQAVMRRHERVHAFRRGGKAVGRGVADLPLADEHRRRGRHDTLPCRLPVRAGPLGLPQPERRPLVAHGIGHVGFSAQLVLKFPRILAKIVQQTGQTRRQPRTPDPAGRAQRLRNPATSHREMPFRPETPPRSDNP